MKNSYIGILPAELLIKIWSYLVNNRDMKSIRQTCSKFRELCDNYGYIRYMRLDSNFTKSEYMRYLSQQNAIYVLELQNITPDEYNEWFFGSNIPIIRTRWCGETRIIKCNM